LAFARKIFDIVISGNYAALVQVLASPVVDDLQLAIVSGAVDRMRSHAWNVLTKAYLQLDDVEFAADMLLFGPRAVGRGSGASRSTDERREEFARFLEQKGFATGSGNRLDGGGLLFRPRRTGTAVVR
jgi:hypothetical protein